MEHEEMTSASGNAHSELIERLDEAVGLPTIEQQAGAVKAILSDSIRHGGVALDDRFLVPKPDCYARRLLHRDTDRGYSAVVMTWGPGQGTALHDHAGIWCVEGTVVGEMEVLQYEISEQHDDRFRFAPRGRVRALPGASGALIPPFEYHVLRNALDDAVSVTLHIYGGEMDHCNVFEPIEDQWMRRTERRLSYDA
jgi:predicted metal-dependent enzyme (double-stranded beta helix superfamily)